MKQKDSEEAKSEKKKPQIRIVDLKGETRHEYDSDNTSMSQDLDLI